MKRKILILTLILLFIGSAALGITLVTLTPEQAYEAASENNVQFEINELNLEIARIAHEKNVKSASMLALNNYYGQLNKYYNPFNSETSLIAKERENEKAFKQLEIDIASAALNLESASLAYDETEEAYNEAVAAYNEAAADSAISSNDILSLKYTMESLLISLHQAENNLESAQRRVDDLIGQQGVIIDLPDEYSNPYDIDPVDAFESALASDIGIYKSARSAEAARIKFDIASEYYDEDEETYISALAGLISAEDSYEKALVSLEIRILDDIDNLKNKYDSISLAELNVKIKLNEYNAAKNQYSAGVTSANQLESAENAYITSRKQLDSKIHDFILSSMRFAMDYGYEF